LYRWKLAELPTVNEFLALLRDKLADGADQFSAPLLAAITLCSKVQRQYCCFCGEPSD
jgi:hypothetical protein